MKTFQINEKIKVVCEWVKTRTAFKHTATLFVAGQEKESTKICYQNRTWESYEYQSVLQKLIGLSSLSEEDKKLCKEYANGSHTDWSDFNRVTAIAKLGDIFCNNKKDSNDWKARMLKAGLESKGLVMPDNWDTLDEETKEARLNLVISQLKNKGDD